MAGSNDDPREIEEGEIDEGEVVSALSAGTGSDTDTDDEDARYYLQPHHDDRRGAGMISALAPASSFGSDGTITDAAVAAGASEGYPCRVCGRMFKGWMAVMGHMRVHAKKDEKVSVAVTTGLTGSLSAVEDLAGDSVSVSTATVVAEPMIFHDAAMPVQSVSSNNLVATSGSGSSSPRSSVEPSQSGAAGPEQIPVAPTPAPPQKATFIPLMIPATAQQDEPVCRRAGLQQQVFGQPPAGRGFSCAECGRWFATHQGLGGHVAGHKNRRLAAEAVVAAAAGIDPHIACRGGDRPQRLHECKICGAEYPSGVSLGGHMRKHYIGKPIVPRKRMRHSLPGFALALPPPVQQQAPPAAPPQLPAGSIRIFGVTIHAAGEGGRGGAPADNENEARSDSV